MNQNFNPLPVIVSRPHGGLAVPEEVQNNLAIDQVALYNDCDLWLDLLYDFNPHTIGHSTSQSTSRQNTSKSADHNEGTSAENNLYGRGVLAQFSMPIARALIDVNRPLEWLGKPDGPIKSHTSYGEAIYKEPLTEEMVQLLLEKYWFPYHHSVGSAMQEHAQTVQLLIDGHNMAQYGPSMYRDAGIERPLICIANMGDANGEIKPERGWTMCPPWFARQAVEIAAELFHDMKLLEPEPNATVPAALLNSPFGGSFVVAHHLDPLQSQKFEETHNRTVPFGIMIEVNRGLYVGNQHSQTEMDEPNLELITEIRNRLYKWVVEIVNLIPQ